nr:mannose-6-phosphate isomerase, class I [Microbacterium marinum]
METLSNAPRDYSWGSVDLIPQLQGREPSGIPEAEIWFGDHPGSPARVAGHQTLAEVRSAAGKAPLPYLLKILAASSSLSIQAHPSVAQAVAGFEREDAAGIPVDAPERTYRDRNHKPEIIVALSERFRALVGLRPVARTRELLGALGEAGGVASLREALAGADAASALREVIAQMLEGGSADVVSDVSAAIVVADAPGFEEELDVLRAIVRDFPGDPGIVVALLMNLVVLHRGEAVFAPAGVLHAYQDGLGVELMAASDNVLRGGLTPKHIDVAELLRIVDTQPGVPAILGRRDAAEPMVFDVGVADFRLRRVTSSSDGEVAMALAGPTIVLAVSGGPSVATAGREIDLAPGEAAYADDETELILRGEGTVYVAEPGS